MLCAKYGFAKSIDCPAQTFVHKVVSIDTLCNKLWLSAIICPVHEKGSCSNVNNYRPISLTSTCAKIMEYIIYHSIMDHLNQNNILIVTV